MPIFAFLYFSSLFIHPSQATPEAIERAPLFIGENEQRVLHLPGLKRFALGSNRVRMTALPSDRDTFLLKGVSVGATDLWVWRKAGPPEHWPIQVEKWTAPKEILRAVSQLREVEVIPVGGQAVLRGTIHTPGEASRVQALRREFPQHITDETTIDPEWLMRAKAELEAWKKRLPARVELELEPVDDQLWLRGAVSEPSLRGSLETQARRIFPPVQLDLEALPSPSKTIYFRVFLLEVKRQEFQSLGLGWPGAQEGFVRFAPGAWNTNFDFSLRLQALSQTGGVKVLSNPEILVRAPGEAELFTGGEVPLRQQNHYMFKVEYRPFGLILKLKVTHFTSTTVRFDISTEVSQLDAQIGQDQIPGFQANRMKTQIDAKFGHPLMLCGLLHESMRRRVQGLQVLKDIPVLGKLFGSEDYQSERSELVAVVIPNSRPPTAPTERLGLHLPRGPVPPPRNWISPREEAHLRRSPNFPWNALE
ncbi:MAG: pilus assembly protein N-terminal domain-containing protein [Bacteriovoracia bacterium]